MSGWEIGDLAVCVETGDLPGSAPGRLARDVGSLLEQGKIYRVIGLGLSRRSGRPTLLLEGVAKPRLAIRFRKVEPDAHEGEMEDWQLLIDAMRVPARATLSGERV